MPMYGYMPVPVIDPAAGQATTSMVLGIAGLVVAFGSFASPCAAIAVITGIVGIVFGVLGRRSTTRKGQATAGLIMSIIAVAGTIFISGLIVLAIWATSPNN